MKKKIFLNSIKIYIFSKDYIGESLLNSFLSYPEMKTKYPIGIIELRHQLEDMTPKKIQLFQEYSANPTNARWFLLLIKCRELELISNGNKLVEVRVI